MEYNQYYQARNTSPQRYDAFRDTCTIVSPRRVSQRKHVSPPTQDSIVLGDSNFTHERERSTAHHGRPIMQEAAGVRTSQKIERANRPLYRAMATPGGETTFSISDDSNYPPEPPHARPTSSNNEHRKSTFHISGSPVNDSYTRFYGGRNLVKRKQNVGGDDHIHSLWKENVTYNESIQEAQRRQAYDPVLMDHAERQHAAGGSPRERQRTVRQIQAPGGGNTTVQLTYEGAIPNNQDYETSMSEAQHRAALSEAAKRDYASSGPALDEPMQSGRSRPMTSPRWPEVGGRSSVYLDKIGHTEHVRYPRATDHQPVGGRGYYFDGEYFQPGKQNDTST